MIEDAVVSAIRAAMERSQSAVAAKKAPDPKDKEENYAAKEAAAKVRSLEEENEDRSSFRGLREKYAGWVYKYLVGYSLACLGILVAHGSKFRGFELPEAVLTALVGSTAVSAIGLVLAVTHGLFKPPAAGNGSNESK